MSAPYASPTGPTDAVRAAAAIEALADRIVAGSPSLPGLVIAVDGPDGAGFTVTRGLADPATAEPLTAGHALRIASCTKPFVASTVLVLEGRGALGLDTPAVELTPPEAAALLARFEHGRTITVRQLLQHRSGMVDHTTFPEFGSVLATDRAHRWTALEQLAIAVSKPALFAPGAAFSYSDSGYVLLGQIIEHLTGLPLPTAVRQLLGTDGLSVPSLHWERMEPTPSGLHRAHQFVDADDTHDWDPSLDLYGGGGLVATMPDMARWWTALFEGRVHPHLDLQTGDTAPTSGPGGEQFPGGDRIGLGIFRSSHGGVEAWGHGGYWGLATHHVPALRTSFAIGLTRRSASVPTPAAVADEVIRALAHSAGLPLRD